MLHYNTILSKKKIILVSFCAVVNGGLVKILTMIEIKIVHRILLTNIIF